MESTVFERIKELRERLKMSQTEFAAACELSQPGYWRIETGESQPRKTTLKRIARAFNVSEDWLISGIGEMEIIPKEKTPDFDPWKDALVSQLKDENTFLKEQIRTMRGMIQLINPNVNFPKGNALNGVFFAKNTGVIVRA